MPASGLSTLSLSGATGSRTWTATAATQDTAAGSSVVITVAQTTTGVPPTAPTTLTLEVRIGSAGAVIRAYTLTLPLTSQQVTFFFTADGTNGTGGRWGTVRMNIRAQQTGGAGATQYDVDVDGTFNTAPTLYPTITRDKGWMRGTTTGTQALSNVSAGGATPASFAFPDSIFLRTTLGHSGYESVTFTGTIGAIRSGTAATSGTTVDVSWTGTSTTTGRVNTGFPASATSQTTGLSVANHALSGVASTVVTLTTTSIVFDPRITFAHYLQINDNTYPGSLPNTQDAVTPKKRRSDQSGALFERITNGRGEGLPLSGGNFAFNTTLTHTSGFTITLTNRLLAASTNGEAGWVTAMMTWVEAGPSGTWTKTETVTGPADITAGPSYWTNGTDSDSYLLIALNPNYAPVAGSTGFGLQSSHFLPGTDDFFVGYALRDTARRVTKLLDAAPEAVINRFNFTLLRLEYLNQALDWVAQQAFAFTASAATDVLTLTTAHGWATDTAVEVDTDFTGTLPAPLALGATYYTRDGSGATLKLAATPGGAAIDITSAGSGPLSVCPVAESHTLDATPDPNVWALVIPTTGTGAAAWTTDDVFVTVTGILDGYPYTGADIQLVVGSENRHDVADPAPNLALNDLTDVDTTGALAGDALLYSGSQWEPGEVDMPTAAEIADAVWDEATVASRPAGSYGDLVRTDLDATVSSRASALALTALQTDATTLLTRLTSGRATLLDNLVNLDASVAALGSPAQATDAATLLARLTATRAGNLDNLDTTVSSRASQASVTALGSPAQAADYTPARAANLDNLDVSVASRASQASVDALDLELDSVVQADDSRLDNLDVPVSTRQPLVIQGGVE